VDCRLLTVDCQPHAEPGQKAVVVRLAGVRRRQQPNAKEDPVGPGDETTALGLNRKPPGARHPGWIQERALAAGADDARMVPDFAPERDRGPVDRGVVVGEECVPVGQ